MKIQTLNRMLKRLVVVFLCLISISVFAKKIIPPKEENTPIENLKKDITELCSSKYGGRLTGTKGEELSANYIEKRFKKIGISGYKGKYQYGFDFKGGTVIGKDAYFKVFENKLSIGKDVVFFPYAKGNIINGQAMPRVYEENNVWLVPISTINYNSTNSPQKLLFEFASKCIEKNAGSIVFLNDIDNSKDLNMQALENFDPLNIAVAFINNKCYLDYIKPNMKKDWLDIDARLGYENLSGTSNNVIASIDNKAPFTVIVAAHYDHLGEVGVLYPGADNNASGVASLLLLSEMIRNNNFKKFNYIFIALSGKENGMQGAKGFIKQNEFSLNNVTCMIDLDMVGRLNNNKDLYLSGVGTSPFWGLALQKINKGFNLQIDSSGVGYGEYSLFYEKNIPVLNISSGFQPEYNRYTDTEDKINYNGIFDITNFSFKLIQELEKENKLIFNKTGNNLKYLTQLKNDIGILHDFSYNQNGCRVATTIPNSKADKAGIQTGDVITKIGTFNIIDTDDYVEAISKSTIGKEVTIIIKRNKVELRFFVTI